MLAFDTIRLKENLSCITAARKAINAWIQTFLDANPGSPGFAVDAFNDISCVLDEVKDDLKKWLDVLWVKISKDISHGIYDFADYFSVIKPEIVSLVYIIKRNMHNNQGDIKKRELIQLLSMLQARIIDQKFSIERFIKLFSLFSGNINSRIKKLFPAVFPAKAPAPAANLFFPAEAGLKSQDKQIPAHQEIKLSLHKFNKATNTIVNCLSEIYEMWDTLIQKITRDIQILKQPDADVCAIEDLHTLDEAEKYWKKLEHTVRV